MPELGGELLKKVGADVGTRAKMIGLKKNGSNTVVHALADDDGRIVTVTQGFNIAIAEGKLGTKTNVLVEAFFNNAAGGKEVISSGGYNEPTSPAQRSISSSSASDDAAGTGVRKVEIVYLDGSDVEKSEIVTLAGTAPVNTVATDIKRIRRFHAVEVGSSGDAVGTVTLHASTVGAGGLVTSIPPGESDWHTAVVHVPAGKTLFIDDLFIIGEAAASVIIDREHDHTADGGGIVTHRIKLPITADRQLHLVNLFTVTAGLSFRVFISGSPTGKFWSVVASGWEQ